MREIKFRALGEKAVGIGRESRIEKYWNYFKVGEISVAKYRDETTSQFTGLKDKNGAEIYEGDILQLSNKRGAVTGVMKWDDERYGWTQFAPLNKFRIIGNIYQNPDLLKGE